MGSSTSKQVTSSNSNSNRTKSKAKVASSKAMVEEESKENDSCLIDADKLEKLAEETMLRIEGDPSLPNLISCFSKMLQEPNLSGFNDVVIAMKDSWDQILKSLDTLAKYIGEQEIKDMKVIHNEYWRLLLKTRVVMQVLVKKCELQKRNVKVLLAIIGTYQQTGGKLSDDEKLAHSECIDKISKWMTIDGLNSLLDDWSAVEMKLKKKQKSWSAVLEQVPHISKKYILANIGKVFGLCVIITGVIIVSVVICTATVGTATPGVVVAATIGAAEIIAVSCAVAAGLAALGLIGIVSYDCLRDRSANKRARKATTKVTNLLKNMIAGSQRIQQSISEVDGETKKMFEECGYLKNAKSMLVMKTSLGAINTHLDGFIKQARKVIDTVDDTCDKIINC